MKNFRSHTGSALLVVLGLLVFVTTSAIAFCVYMRQQRLPSSMARRTATSRQLVKAALARAIAEINDGNNIGDTPLTRVHRQGIDYWPWKNRVFMPKKTTNSGPNTVLTLEGLAYLPPNLVNDVRYYAQQTSSAEWHILPFDMGRYAFVAVDVTDYLDVNQLVASRFRSSAPNARLSAAYLFENEDHTKIDQKALTEWDKFMSAFREVDDESGRCIYEGTVPLVSLADFNLALHAKGGKEGVAGFVSPFCRYVTGTGEQKDAFYGETIPGGREMYRRMTFVTDSLPPLGLESRPWKNPEDGSMSSTYYDLTKSERQPFKFSDLESESYPQMYKVMNYISNKAAMERLQINIPLMTKVALWDYLDTDSVPISLAAPTTERTAMVCGLQLVPSADGGMVSVSSRTDEEVGKTEQGGKKMRRTEVYGIDAQKLGYAIADTKLRVLLTYPFSHKRLNKDAEFDVDVRVAYYLAHNDGGYIPIRSEMDLGSSGLLDYGRTPNLDPDSKKLAGFEDDFEKSALVIQFKEDAVVFPKSGGVGDDEYNIGEEYLQQVGPYVDALTFQPGGTTLSKEIWNLGTEKVKSEDQPNGIDVIPIVKIVTEWEQDKNGQPANPPADAQPTVETPAIGLVNKDNTAYTPDAIKADIEKGNFNLNFRLEAAVWARVKMDDEIFGEDQVVDLAPANVLYDDKLRSGSSGKGIAQQMDRIGEAGSPLIKFVSSEAFAYQRPTADGTVLNVEGHDGKFKFDKTTAFVADPRYNHAPENWFTDGFADDDESKLAKKWLSVNKAKEMDGDIFMAVSDQGCLQSIYEFAFLPCLSAGGIASFRSSDDPLKLIFGDLANHTEPSTLTELPGSFEQTKDPSLAWNTFSPFDGGDDFNEFGFCSEGYGQHINPYSDETNVIYSVFANTPLNWSLAYTNNPDVANMEVDKFNEKYAYCDYNENYRLSWSDLDEIVKKVGGVLRNGYSNDIYDWEEDWRENENLVWQLNPDDPSKFLGLQLDSSNYKFTSADRKFLYGYWHDCFGVGQQLYLVFVRCEPMMMGSDSRERIPPQLGTRIVALVWRDAHPPGNPEFEDAPHRTRVLFYRQLD